MSQGRDYHHTLKVCGNYHSYCRVCRPDLCVPKKQTKMGTLTADETTAKYAPGYVPHPTKTMWERHVEENKPDPMPTKNVREFTDKELRDQFGFSRDLIRKFRLQERRKVLKLRAEKLKQKKLQARLDAGLPPHPNSKATEAIEIRRERDKRILEMRLDDQMSLREIAEALVPPATGERVRQILTRLEKEAGVTFPKTKWELRGIPKVVKVGVHCKICDKVLVLPENKVQEANFCKEHRLTKLGYERYLKDPNYINLDDNARHRWAYHHDPRVREVTRNAAKNWVQKIKKENGPRWAKYKKQQTDAARVWNRRKAAILKAKKQKANPPRKYLE